MQKMKSRLPNDDQVLSENPASQQDLSLSEIQEFLVGFANSMFQASNESCGETNWSYAAHTGSVAPLALTQLISHWYNFEDDLHKMKSLGVNSYRFSIEWGHIEPQEGVYDEEVLARYEQIIAECLRLNIKPMLTLYHFNEPYWFTQKGSFEKEENFKYFVAFCKKIFERFSSSVKHWCTINEPGVMSFSSYFYGQFPPHKHSLKQTIQYQLNLLKAHVLIYKELKQMENGPSCEIGIVHNVLRFVPRHKWDLISKFLAPFLTRLVNDCVVKFLQTGRFEYKVRGLVNVKYDDVDAPNSFDFVGLNFYGNVVIGFNKKNFYGATHFPGQTLGHFHIPIDPSGFSSAISEIAALGKPIYITETGYATDHDEHREKFLSEYFKVLETKIAENVDIRGLYIWTFIDNYEWDRGHEIKFGLHDQYRVQRGSAKIFQSFTNKILNKPTE